MNARPAVLFMRSAGKEGSGDRDGEGERGRRGDRSVAGHSIHFCDVQRGTIHRSAVINSVRRHPTHYDVGRSSAPARTLV